MPLAGVAALMGAAGARGIPTLLDVDVPPSIAAGAARLCDTPVQVFELARTATVLKTTRTASAELLALAGAPSSGLASPRGMRALPQGLLARASLPGNPRRL